MEQLKTVFHLSGRRLLILLIAWMSLFAGINSIPVEDHEAFVLQTAREMDANGDWVVPFFNQEPRLKKPPLNYWLTLGISHLDPFSADIEPWHGRICSVFAGLFILLLTAYTGKKLYGGQAGFLAAVLLLGTKGFADFSHNARPDFLYAVLCAVQLFAWIGAWKAKDRSSEQQWMSASGWILAGLATLTKGPQVPAIFLLGFLLFLLCSTERRRTLDVLRPVSGIVIWLILCLPWWWFLKHQLQTMGVNIAETQLSGSLLQTLAGWKELFSFFYIARMLSSLLPVALILPLLIFWSRRNFTKPGAASRLLLYVCVVMLMVFTVAGHYRPHYMLPLHPLIILLLAAGIDKGAAGHSLHKKIWFILFFAGMVAVAVCAVLLVWQQQYAAFILLAGVGLALFFLVKRELHEPIWHDHPFAAQMLMGSLLAAWLFAGFNALPLRNIERNRERVFAQSVGQTVEANGMLVAWGEFPEILPYYARHRIVSVGESAELGSRFEQRGSGQNFYVLVAQKNILELKKVFDYSIMLTDGNKKESGKLILVKITDIHR